MAQHEIRHLPLPHLGFTKGTPLIPDVAEETPPQNDDEEVQPKPVTANMIKAVEVREAVLHHGIFATWSWFKIVSSCS